MLKNLIELSKNLDFGLDKIEEFQNISLSGKLKEKLKVGFQSKEKEIKFLDNCTIITSKKDDPRIFPNIYYHFAKVLFQDFSPAVKEYWDILHSAKARINKDLFISLKEFKPVIKYSTSTLTEIILDLKRIKNPLIQSFIDLVKDEIPEEEDQKSFYNVLFFPEARLNSKNPFDDKGIRTDFLPTVLGKALPINFTKHGNNLPTLIEELFDMEITTSELESGIQYLFKGYPPNSSIKKPHNRIVYGAPGTGKSYQLKEDLKDLPEESINRVTFNPEMTYGQFIGSNKPVNHQEEKRIVYEFIPGPFLNSLVKAALGEPVVLLIEEINRANVAAVFGDFFQTLDRDDEGNSIYGINCSPEVSEYLKANGLLERNDKIYLPPNLYIWATMNSADQGVFTLDTAFKRRWTFEYIPLNSGNEIVKDWELTLEGNHKIKWNSFRNVINETLLSFKVPEDKLIGPFFLSKKEMESEHGFQGKLLLYLWDDVLRHKSRNSIFKSTSLSDFIEKIKLSNGSSEELIKGIFADEISEKFLLNLNIMETIENDLDNEEDDFQF